MRSRRALGQIEPRPRAVDLEQEPSPVGWSNIFDIRRGVPDREIQLMLEKANQPYLDLTWNPFKACDLLFIRPDLREHVNIDEAGWDLLTARIENTAQNHEDDYDYTSLVIVRHILYPSRRVQNRAHVTKLGQSVLNKNCSAHRLIGFGEPIAFDALAQTSFAARLVFPEYDKPPSPAVLDSIFDRIKDYNLSDLDRTESVYLASCLRLAWPQLSRDDIPFHEVDFAKLPKFGDDTALGKTDFFSRAVISADKVEITPNGDIVITPRLTAESASTALPQRSQL